MVARPRLRGRVVLFLGRGAGVVRAWGGRGAVWLEGSGGWRLDSGPLPEVFRRFRWGLVGR